MQGTGKRWVTDIAWGHAINVAGTVVGAFTGKSKCPLPSAHSSSGKADRITDLGTLGGEASVRSRHQSVGNR